MLTKQKCIEAINRWEIARSNYSAIEDLIPPGSVFKFVETDCTWIAKNNQSSYFHAYAGINEDNAMILIIIPLSKGKNENEKDKEIEFAAYPAASLELLEKGLTILDTSIIKTTQKTVLSAVMDLEDCSEKIESAPQNAPSINESSAIADLLKWKSNYLDWFYRECSEFGGKRIFKVFTVPLPDLKIDEDQDGKDKYNEVVVTFGFKTSDIYQREIPILIFIAVNSETLHSQIIHPNTDSGTDTNTRDYSHPCPPMCRLEKSFALLGLATE